ncbi:MAG: Fpg/Nei family DNA glycosylase [Planctomycetota bacterium]
MPELPDVETFRRYLQSTALHETVRTVTVSEPRVLENVSAPGLRRALAGRPFERTRRQGKVLFVACGEARWLALHFGMTGRLAYYRDPDAAPDHPRVVFALTNGYHLAFDCSRMLGRMWLLKDCDAFLRAHEIGPDALRIEADAFVDAVRAYRGGLKSFLMNQARLAGVGNVYADEALFQARRDPTERASALDDRAARRLHRVVQRVLTTAVERNAERERLPRTWITPRRGGDDPACPRGCGTLQTKQVNGRTTWWCPSCQG